MSGPAICTLHKEVTSTLETSHMDVSNWLWSGPAISTLHKEVTSHAILLVVKDYVMEGPLFTLYKHPFHGALSFTLRECIIMSI